MNRSNKEFCKSPFGQDLTKNLPFNVLSSMSSMSSLKKRQSSISGLVKSIKKQDACPHVSSADFKKNELNKFYSNKETKESIKFLQNKSLSSSRSFKKDLYYSNDFSDFYKKELKIFSTKFKLLQSRYPIKGKTLKKEIALSKYINQNFEYPVIKQIFDVTDRDVNHVNCSKDSTSLVLKILKQINPEMEADLVNKIKPKKYYYRSDKPLGNNKSCQIDYTTNNRYDHSNEIKFLMKQAKYKGNKASGMTMSIYDENDSDIRLFYKAEEELSKEEEGKDPAKKDASKIFQTIVRANNYNSNLNESNISNSKSIISNQKIDKATSMKGRTFNL